MNNFVYFIDFNKIYLFVIYHLFGECIMHFSLKGALLLRYKSGAKMFYIHSRFQNVPVCPISASGEKFNQRNMQNIPVVEIFDPS